MTRHTGSDRARTPHRQDAQDPAPPASAGRPPTLPAARGDRTTDDPGAPRPAARSLTDSHTAPLERLADRLSREVGPDRYRRYFDRHARLSVEDDALGVTVPSAFHAQLIERRFGESLRRAADGRGVRIRVDHAAFEPAAPPAPAPAAPARPSPHDHPAPGSPRARAPRSAPHASPRARRVGADADLRHRLDDFVEGESNRLAYAAACRLAEPDAPRAFSPLFIHGGCGLGKTHLLQGIVRRVRERDPGRDVRYLSAEQFTGAYVAAVRAGSVDAFRAEFRSAEVLCIDDAHLLAGRQATQTEFLHMLDAVRASGALIALASDAHPRDLDRLSQALQSRFVSGMVVRLHTPDPALVAQLVRRLAQRRGLRLGDEGVARLVARLCPMPGDRVPGDPGRGDAGSGLSVREIEGLLTRVEAVRTLLGVGAAGSVGAGNGHAGSNGHGPGDRAHSTDSTGSPSSIDHGPGDISPLALDAALGSTRFIGRTTPQAPERGPVVQPEAILAEVCSALGVERSACLGSARGARVVLARALVVYLTRTLTSRSFPEIARDLARPSHSSVVSAWKRFGARLASRPDERPPELGGLSLREACDRLSERVRRATAPARG